MKLKDILLKEESEEMKADKAVKLAKNSAEREIMELEHHIIDAESEMDDMYHENLSLSSIVELEQDIAVMKDKLERMKNKLSELF